MKEATSVGGLFQIEEHFSRGRVTCSPSPSAGVWASIPLETSRELETHRLPAWAAVENCRGRVCRPLSIRSAKHTYRDFGLHLTRGALIGHTVAMQTGCPKCKTIVRTDGVAWTILNGSCPELAGTPWEGKPEYCPVLSMVAEPDVTLPGLGHRAQVQAEIDRARVLKVVRL